MKAIDILKTKSYTCVIVKSGTVAAALNGLGVKPILTTLDRYPQMLVGAQVADKVIGKAAAMLLVKAEVEYVYGDIMSKTAVDYLEAHNIPFGYGDLVNTIQNRTMDGSCPLERAVSTIDDKDTGITAVRATISKLMAAKG